jgi:hypothetical protein
MEMHFAQPWNFKLHQFVKQFPALLGIHNVQAFKIVNSFLGAESELLVAVLYALHFRE